MPSLLIYLLYIYRQKEQAPGLFVSLLAEAVGSSYPRALSLPTLLCAKYGSFAKPGRGFCVTIRLGLVKTSQLANLCDPRSMREEVDARSNNCPVSN